MTSRTFAGLAALFLAVPTLASAQDAATPPAGASTLAEDFDRETITVGLGAGYLPDYEGSDDYQLTPVPGVIGTVGGINFQVLGNRASADLIPGKPGPTWDFQAGPIGVVNFMRSNRSGIDDPRVRALGELDTAIELGGYVGIGKTGVVTSPYDRLSVSVSYRHDISGVHKSGIWQPTINYLTPLSTKAAVAFFASAEHAGRGYATSYFSLSPAQTLVSGLPTYNARGGWKNYSLGALATYSLTGNLLHGWKVVAGGTYRRMLNDFGDSPLVSVAGSRNQWLGAVGVAYTF